MERLDKIYQHPLWKLQIEQLKQAETNRIYCCHGIEHLLDVARIAYIENIENNYGISKEIIYATALLHDIGRYIQYQTGIAHGQAGLDLASIILKDCYFDFNERNEILSAILNHNNKDVKEEKNLKGLLYRADKQSRMCMFCNAVHSCKWSEDKKNHQIKI